jgi:hypothetical protein
MSGWRAMLINEYCNGNSTKIKYRAEHHIDADRQTDKQTGKERNKQSHTATIKTISNHDQYSDKVVNKAAGNTAVKPANTNTHTNTDNLLDIKNKQQTTDTQTNNKQQTKTKHKELTYVSMQFMQFLQR